MWQHVKVKCGPSVGMLTSVVAGLRQICVPYNDEDS